MKLSLKSLVAAVTLPILLSACSSNDGDAKKITEADLLHHNWELVQIDGEAIELKQGQQAPSLEFGEKMNASGTAGCNRYFGKAELKDNHLRIEKMAMTMKMCRTVAMKLEKKFSGFMSDWSKVTLTDDNLMLKNQEHTLVFKLSDWKE